MARYKTKPCEIEAVVWTGKNVDEMRNFTGNQAKFDDIGIYGEKMLTPLLFIKTLEGKMYASVGDYIVKDINGSLNPCKPDVFQKKYEPVEE